MLLAIVVFILIISLVIFIHELGHFIFSKISGVRVEEFCIGYPPRIWKKKKGETLYSIGIIPFGGFNKIYGEIGNDHSDDPRSFSSMPVLTRALIVVSGVVMNVLLAVVVFYFLLGFAGFQSYQILIFDYDFPFGRQDNFAVVGDFSKDSPAKEKGIEEGDMIVKINGLELGSSKKVAQFIKENKGQNVSLYLENLYTKETKDLTVFLRPDPPEGEGPLGVALTNVARVSYPSTWQKASAGFLHSLNILHYSVSGFAYLGEISFQEKDIKPLSSSVSGPIGILAFTEMTLDAGFTAVITLLAVISLALALFNILPIPALDGGKLVFLAIEAVTGRAIPRKIEENLTFFFFFLLIILMVFVTINDVQKFF